MRLVTERVGYDSQQSGAVQAYLQAAIRGTPFWLSSSGAGGRARGQEGTKPVVRCNVALYGHLDSGVVWEAHSAEPLFRSGFVNEGDPVPIEKISTYCSACMLLI